MPNSLYGNYRTNKFVDIFETFNDFKTEYGSTIFKQAITDAKLEILYYLLYARFGNSHIANSDENQFKYKLYATIWQFGPVWEKKLQVQKDLRNLSLAELQEGTKQVSDHAYNPSTVPSGEIETINEQDRTKYKKSKADAYATIMELMEQDVTEEFLTKFKPLFLVITEPQEPLLYSEV